MSDLPASATFNSLQRSIVLAKDTLAVDDAVRLVWQSHGAGHLLDHEAQALSDFAQERRCKRTAPASPPHAQRAISRFKPRRLPCSPDRQARLERRRDLGGAGNMPSAIRRSFTEGQRAALTIIAGEVKRHGQCELSIDEIADRAGCRRTTVQNAVHEARRLGLITVIERPQRGRKSLTNVVRIVSKEWVTWLKRGPIAHRQTGSKLSSQPSKIVNTSKITGRIPTFYSSSPPSGVASVCNVHGLREERGEAVAQNGTSWR